MMAIICAFVTLTPRFTRRATDDRKSRHVPNEYFNDINHTATLSMNIFASSLTNHAQNSTKTEKKCFVTPMLCGVIER